MAIVPACCSSRGSGRRIRLIPALLPGLVAAAIGYVIFVGFGLGGLEAPGLIVPNLPPYEGVHPGDLSMGIASVSRRCWC